MGCISCGTDLPDGAAFCPHCGTPQAAQGCAQCGADLVAEAAFCFKCGTPLGGTVRPPATSERRLTSVLFADLVSYTSISEHRDTEDVRELLSAYFDTCQTVVRRYGGTVEKFIGDAVMAVWGVPVAHEDDAERAVRAALELVEQVSALGDRLQISELTLRVGVVTGEVAATVGATDQGMVAGDAVNTAARVQSTAGSGEVWVDGQTRSLTTAAVTYLDMGEHALKGKVDLVRLYRAGTVVAAVGGLQRVDGLEAPLVGRDREMRLIKELFHAVEESGRPQLVVLDGEAGIGKSRLGWEFEKYIDGLSVTVRWHRGRCLSYGDGVAFWALAEMVRTRIGLLEDDAGDTVLMGLDRVLADVVADGAERDWLRPRMASLLGEESREFGRDDLFGAWARFFERVAATDPLVLLVDDAEHLDDGLADFLDFLLETARFPCFVLALARPELLTQRPHLGGRRSTPIRVDPLPDPAMSRLLDGLVAGFPREVHEQLVVRAEGIPLYAVETVRALIDRDLVVPVEGRYVVAEGAIVDLSAIGAPASLQALVSSRLDALSSAEHRVVSDASVLGESFSREGITILAGDVPDLDAVLAGLTRKELIATDIDRFSAERGQFRFVQSVVRQVAYSTLSRRDRKARHLQVAEHLSAEIDRADELSQVIARHLLDAAEASGDEGQEVAALRSRAGVLMVRAADRAAGLGALEDAVRLYQIALECLEEPVDRAETLVAMATRLVVLHGEDTAIVARRAKELYHELGDPTGAGEAAYLEALGLFIQDRLEESVATARAAYDALAGHGEDLAASRARGRLACQLAAGLVFDGQVSDAAYLVNEALVLAERTQDVQTIRRAGNILAVQHARMGSHQVGRILLRGLADLARADEDWPALKLTLTNLGSTLALSDLQAGVEVTQEGIAVAQDHGLPVDDAQAINLVNYAWLAGSWDRLDSIVDDDGHPVGEGEAASAFAQICRDLCAWAGRRIGPPEKDRIEIDTVDRLTRIMFDGARSLADGDEESAVAALRELVAAELSLNALGDDMHVFWPLAVRVAHQGGDRAGLQKLGAVAQLVDQRATRTDALAGHARVFAALLELASPDPDLAQVEVDLREGIAALDPTGHVVWTAHAREDLGQVLMRQGRTEEAHASLNLARAAYERMGAAAWVSRVDEYATVAAP